ncbi:hypothetical protein L2E82_30157 [Cichorium intybus]|uniref:Uncharacterized protein n=1 Tax=Cichorium intybus TaxID=13427 RepID=A0ACB9CZU8_CICIN|nr:hypothetical protein L2E82_30157 [Cichorium intybus]
MESKMNSSATTNTCQSLKVLKMIVSGQSEIKVAVAEYSDVKEAPTSAKKLFTDVKTTFSSFSFYCDSCSGRRQMLGQLNSRCSMQLRGMTLRAPASIYASVPQQISCRLYNLGLLPSILSSKSNAFTNTGRVNLL